MEVSYTDPSVCHIFGERRITSVRLSHEREKRKRREKKKREKKKRERERESDDGCLERCRAVNGVQGEQKHTSSATRNTQRKC